MCICCFDRLATHTPQVCTRQGFEACEIKNSMTSTERIMPKSTLMNRRKRRKARGVTFSKFLTQCPAAMKSPSVWHLKHLEKFFGSKPIAQIADEDVTAYRDKRSEREISSSTASSQQKWFRPPQSTRKSGNASEVSPIRTEKGIRLPRVTEFKMAPETPRNRIFDRRRIHRVARGLSTAWLRRALHNGL